MTSEKQVRANRQNAKKGGVKTKKGKSKSSLNAIKHGIFTKVIVALTEDRRIINRLRNLAFKALKPQGIIEEAFADRIVVCLWRLRRCTIVDRASMEYEFLSRFFNKDMEFNEKRKLYAEIAVVTKSHLELLLRYETTIERQLYRLITELRNMQRTRFDSESRDL